MFPGMEKLAGMVGGMGGSPGGEAGIMDLLKGNMGGIASGRSVAGEGEIQAQQNRQKAMGDFSDSMMSQASKTSQNAPQAQGGQVGQLMQYQQQTPSFDNILPQVDPRQAALQRLGGR